MTLTIDWGISKIQRPEDANFNCGFISRLNERCGLYYEDPKWLFDYLFMYFNASFPRHFVFANFRCLRCGELCNDEKNVYREDIKRWMIEAQHDILAHVDCLASNGWCFDLSDLIEPCEDCRGGFIVTHARLTGRCPFVRKVRNKPYYKCRIHNTSPEEP